MKRELTSEEIEKLTSRIGVKRVHAENFLRTMTPYSPEVNRANVFLDAGLYKWNSVTVNAILKGIDLASR